MAAVNSEARSRAFVGAVGLCTAAILLQAVTAGVFVNQSGRDSWVTVHGVIADITWLSALAAAVIGFVRLRRSNRSLWLAAGALFVLTLAQTGIGHLITDEGMDWLIAVHVPLAMVIFGLAGWLFLTAIRGRRVVDGFDPYGAAARNRQEARVISDQ